MQNTKYTKISIFFLLISFFITPFSTVNADDNFATLSLVLDKSTFLDKEIIVFDLQIDSASTTINTIDARLNFDPNKLKLISVNASSSICNFFINETIDNSNGNYQILCGTNQNNITGNNVVTLTFKKILSGLTQINLSPDSQILQNDGFGTSLPVIGEVYNILIIK